MGRPAEDLTGKKFGRLTVIRRATEEEWPRGSGRHAKWLCQCECGKQTFVQSSDLKNGTTVSCGCKNRETAKKLAYNLGKERFDDLTGKRFGKLVVLNLAEQRGKNYIWNCKCDCGALTKVSAGNLRDGHTKSCGCLKKWGDGYTSKGEEKIITLLKKDSISFEREKTFPDLKKHNHNLRFDFYIPESNTAIEFNGNEHYYYIEFFHHNQQGFKKRQEYDRYKISYCLSHGIKLYIIPYWELEHITTARDLLRPQYLATTRWKNDQDWIDHQKI